MRIQRIEVIGFKSFSNRTVININEPITAVVGPNGCGKSNIIDAIRWCMGEQSAKHLRGKSMDDVIFSGSETRGPASMAEVSLTFEDVALSPVLSSEVPEEREAVEGEEAEGSEPSFEVAPAIDLSEYSEVTVTRRLYRDGTSEYYINKTPCRLRDITDFFLGTGVGTKAYSIIEQGRVGLIVSAKPEERRLIIDEAAGITKFKKRKQAAERKMEQTRSNLLRVSDVVGELDKHLGSLRRQAQKAERYKRYRAEVRDIELWSASHRWLATRVEEDRRRAAHAEVAERRDGLRARNDTAEAAIAAERAETTLAERSLADATAHLYDLENRVSLGESQVEFGRREARDLEGRAQTGAGECAAVRGSHTAAAAELESARAEAARLEGEASGRAAELARLDEEVALGRARAEDAQAELDLVRAEIGGAQAEIARAENNERALARRGDDQGLRLARVVDEEVRAAARAAELAELLLSGEANLAGLRESGVDLGRRRVTLEGRIGDLRTAAGQNEATLETLRTELHRRRSRLVSLKEIQERYEGFQRGTRAIMQHRRGDGVRGLLADIVRAPAEFEAAVEAVLGERLGSVLVDNQDSGRDAVAFLKQRAQGRASFIPVAAAPAGDRGAIEVVEAEGVRGPLGAFVATTEEYSGLADVLFGDVLVVEDLRRAIDLWRSGVRRTLVTLDGDVVDKNGVVSGGSRDASGGSVLGQKREIRELEEITTALDRDTAAALAESVATRAEMQAVGGELDAVRRGVHEGELSLLTHEKDVARFRVEAERLAERRGQLHRERVELEAALAETRREADETAAKLAAARGRAGEAERRQLGLIESVTIARSAFDDAAAGATETRVRVAQVGAERAAARGRVAALADQIAELAARAARLEQQTGESRERAALLLAQAEEASRGLVELRDERRRRAEEVAAGRAAHEARTAALAEAELAARGLRVAAEAAAAEATRHEVRAVELAGERRHVEDAMAERYRVDLGREVFDHHLRPPISDVEEARLAELRELIERMGEINLTAIEEHEEVSRRYDFLVAQKADLEGALTGLERAIAKINKTSRRRFQETFSAVNRKFQEVFPRLFRGGRGELRLVGGEEDILTAGIEIIAQPPGKKIVTIDVLSGGEKALTAVALIFSIFLHRPSPFCILDEVDAPLDEANVGRYNDLVREMTDRSQFIVITHNKRTMEIADNLYGVTMEEPGCSKLVSVNLRVLSGGRQPLAKAS